MRKTTADRPIEAPSRLFSPNVKTYTLIYSSYRVKQTFAKQTGLNSSASKTHVMCACVHATTDAPITVNDNPLDYLTYLGSLVSKDNAAQEDIRARHDLKLTN